MDADFVFGETNTNTAFICSGCVPSLELNVIQSHIIINALSNARFDRALFDYEQAELDRIMSILVKALEVNQ